jgi:hypothetical protein
MVTMADCYLLCWLNIVHAYSEMETLPNRADAARRLAEETANQLGKVEVDAALYTRARTVGAVTAHLPGEASDICSYPRLPNLTPGQTEQVRELTRQGFVHGWYVKPPWPVKKPSEYLADFLIGDFESERAHNDHARMLGDRGRRGSLQQISAKREALEQIAHNRALVELLDECWEIGRQTAVRIFEKGKPSRD